MFQRHLDGALGAALADTPVVLVQGARQVGKSTMAERWAAASGGRYVSLDDLTVLGVARADPAGFLAGLERPVVLDEVQRAPDLLLAIKRVVDRDRRPGQFLLTGSADVLLLPRVAESLAGRMEVLTLGPLSQGELEGVREAFVERVFGAAAPVGAFAEPRQRLVERILRGGYPEAVARRDAARRGAWYGAYLTTVLLRDVRDLSRLEDVSVLPRVLSLLASRATGLLNWSDVARDLAMPLSTLKRYAALLERLFLTCTLPAWSGNLGRRLVKAPKGYVIDSGLLAHLVGAGVERLRADPLLLGPLLESFVAMELRRQAAWSRTRVEPFHFRAGSGQEVDVVLEDAAGRLVGIEVKARATVEPRDLAGLRLLAAERPKRFHRGLVLYLGDEVVPFGERLHAVPMAALWRWGARKAGGA